MPTLHLQSEASGSEQLLEVVTTSGSEPNHDDHRQQARKAARLGCIWSLCGCASAIPTWSSTSSFKLDFETFFTRCHSYNHHSCAADCFLMSSSFLRFEFLLHCHHVIFGKCFDFSGIVGICIAHNSAMLFGVSNGRSSSSPVCYSLIFPQGFPCMPPYKGTVKIKFLCKRWWCILYHWQLIKQEGVYLCANLNLLRASFQRLQ